VVIVLRIEHPIAILNGTNDPADNVVQQVWSSRVIESRAAPSLPIRMTEIAAACIFADALALVSRVRDVDRKGLRRLFPLGTVTSEKVLGFTKSFEVWGKN
jgi:hypothetical protein